MSDVKQVAADVVANSVLDAKGLSCPMPLLRTKKEIGKLKSGEVLQVDGTDPGSRNDIPGWCDRAGHEYLGEKEESGYFSFNTDFLCFMVLILLPDCSLLPAVQILQGPYPG